MQLRLDLNKLLLKLEFSLYLKPNKWTEGYSNRTVSGHYVTFLDYDGMKEEWVRDDIQRLMDVYDLDHFILFKTSERSYHAVNLQKVTAFKYMSILKNSSTDPVFRSINASIGWRSWVLRTGDKTGKGCPKFYELVKNKNEPYKGVVSGAHLEYLFKSGLLPKTRAIIKYFNRTDDCKELYLIAYKCESKKII